WEKMRQVLWPKYLLGGFLQRRGGGIGAAERGEASGFGSGGGRWRDLIGRWPDADVVLQGGMSEGLRDWDLWYVSGLGKRAFFTMKMLIVFQGSAHFLPTTQHVSLHVCGRRPIVACLLRRVFHCMDWRGHCHFADQAARWKHVCRLSRGSNVQALTWILVPSSNLSASLATRSSRLSLPPF